MSYPTVTLTRMRLCTARTPSGDTRDHICRLRAGHPTNIDHECTDGHKWANELPQVQHA